MSIDGDMRSKSAIVAAVSLALALALFSSQRTASAAPALQLPWPTGHQHRISGGNSYNCGTHNTNPASSGTAYNADYYAIDLQFGSVDGSPLDIAATASGTVIFRGDAQDAYGNKIVIDHGGGYLSVYAHLASFAAGTNPPAVVSQGQFLGYAGGTGGPYPVHLHFHMQNGLAAYQPEPMSGVSGFGQYGACTGVTSPYWSAQSPVLLTDLFLWRPATGQTTVKLRDPGPDVWDSAPSPPTWTGGWEVYPGHYDDS